MSYIIPNKHTHEYVIGIDFGHGETSADICNIQWQDNYLKLLPPESIEIFNNVNAIKSVLLIEELEGETNYFIGEQAISRFGSRKKQSAAKQSYYSYFKKAPSKMTPEERQVMESFMREVYLQIRRQRSELTDTNHLVYIACPSNSDKWSDQEQIAYADIALSAGLPLATIDGVGDGIIRESRAAFLKARNNPKSKSSIKEGILLIDFGSSTVDLTYYSTHHTEKPIDDGGAECGASNVEIRITDELKRTEPKIQEAIDANPSAATAVLLAVREAKEKYYSFDGEDMEISISLTKLTGGAVMGAIEKYYSDDEIIKILSEYIGEIRTCFEQYRDRYLTNMPIKMIFLTGGASRMQFIQDLARDVFHYEGEFYREINPSLTISNGIALAGRADLRSSDLKGVLDKDIDEIGNQNEFPNKVIEAGSKEIANGVLDVIEKRYELFKSRTADSSLESLESEIKEALSGMDYTAMFNKPFADVLREVVNVTVLPELNAVVADYFPDEKLKEITTRQKISTDVTISTENIEPIINKSVDSISEGLMLGLLKVLGSIVGGIVSMALAAVIRVLGNPEKGFWETADSIASRIMPNWNGKDTVLDSEKRATIYANFLENRPSFAQNIQESLCKDLNSNQQLNDSIKAVFKTEAKKYVEEQIKQVRLMLN